MTDLPSPPVLPAKRQVPDAAVGGPKSSAPRRKPRKPAWVRVSLDRIAGQAITLGGIAVIVSILAILVFLVVEVLPLFWPATVSRTGELMVPGPPRPGAAAALGVDEHQAVAYVVKPDGIVFLDLQKGRPLRVDLPTALQGKRVTAVARDGGSSPAHVLGTADGLVIPVKIAVATSHAESGARTKHPVLEAQAPIQVMRGPIHALAYRSGNSRTAIVATDGQGEVRLLHREAAGDSAPPRWNIIPVAAPSGGVTALALDAGLSSLFLGDEAGQIHHFRLFGSLRAEWVGTYPAETAGDPVTRLGFLLGDHSLVAMTQGGATSTWILVRDSIRPGGWALRRNHRLASQGAAITAFASSLRDKGFVTGDAAGGAFLRHATSEQVVLRLPAASAPLVAVALAPKADALLTYDAAGRLSHYALRNPHPEVTWNTLFRPVWYEGYDHPAHVWQSSSGSDDFEPKFGLLPLAFGTLKGTVYALLLAIPIAILAAIFTSQFMHPSWRATIKPTIEVMAALPTVVLGFLAGLWLAPLLERLFPALVGMALLLPALAIAAALAWHLGPQSFRHRFRPGIEALLLIPLLLAGMALCLAGNDAIEQALFRGDFKTWLAQTFGLGYDQRNAVVVGIMMGFAIIPIIYSISEEALTNVPRNLVAGSLALGATRWQTVAHMVLLAASPGIFSAVMIGFGRAIGETMIVLMATGNTPILDWSWFNGFRTLSANIAVEIPEAPQAGTLYRVLFLAALVLFIVTFVINTAAEIVRQRLREKHSHT